MARNTAKEYRNQVIYSVFVRNYSKEGTFEAVRRDLERIKSLGVDVIWLMPIHPIGAEKRKGAVGSPYAISDYRAVNPDYGSLEDFQRLLDDIHRLVNIEANQHERAHSGTCQQKLCMTARCGHAQFFPAIRQDSCGFLSRWAKNPLSNPHTLRY